ncbi:MAG: hypothetical protein FD176_3325 [Rhodospirillaceae bacterium]|nr:MAG: hypothetical protein FD176_3325 [Rhodospirillaceae bacterium]TNC93488.1 MAG: Uncharacterized protein FD119_3962 [Stygiobacter sp.]
MNALDHAIVAYWRHPDPRGVLDVFVGQPLAEDWRAENVLTVPVFLAHLLEADPSLGAILVEGVRGGDPVKVEITAQALNYSHIPARTHLMEKLVGEAAAASMDADGADFAALCPTHPVHVDMLWVSFFATGVTAYLDRITGLLDGWLPENRLQDLLSRAATQPDIQAPALAGLLAKAAQVTLTAHGQECPPVRAALERRAASMDGLGAALAARIAAIL